MALPVKIKLPSFSSLSLAAFILMVIIHLVGAIGLNNVKYRLVFEHLSGFNLLFSFILVMAFQYPVNKNFFVFCALAFIIGTGAEIIGVNTGYPFGNYSYTGLLGPRFFNVPLIIGLNWVLLSYVTGVTVAYAIKPQWQRVITASALMVAIDLLLESLAVRHHFWAWKNISPPLQNYVSWFFISLIIQYFFARLNPNASNITAIRYLAILLIFLSIDFLFSMMERTF